MSYFDCYLIPLAADRLDDYQRFSQRMSAVYREYGVVRIVECVLDPDTADGSQFHAAEVQPHLRGVSLPDFYKAAATRVGEIVVLSWVEWPSKKIRDETLPRILADLRIQPEAGEIDVFDGRRLIAGGFVQLPEN